MATPRPRRRALDALLAVAAAVWVAVATFPYVTPPPATLDGSWQIEINRVLEHGGFSGDTAFTYGPLGFVLAPGDDPASLAAASALRFAVQGAIALLVGALVWRGRRRAAAALAASWVVAVAFGLMFEHALVLLLGVLALSTLTTAAPWGLAAAAGIAGLALAVKTSVGVAALGICATAGLLLLWHRGVGGAWRALALALAAFAGAVTVDAVLLRRPDDLWPWLRTSLEIADGYSVAMSTDYGAAAHVTAGAVGFALAAALALWLLRRGAVAGDLAAIFALPVFVAFKHAFVRHDAPHEVAFFPVLVAALALVLVHVRRRSEQVVVAAALALATAGAGILVRRAGSSPVDAVLEVARASRGAAYARAWADVPGEVRRYRAAVEAAAAASAGDARTGPIRGRTVGILPWDLSRCRATGVRCVPNPTLQTFVAYTAALDARTAAHYAGDGAPEYVVLDDVGLDGRSVVLDSPATTRAVLEHYAPEARAGPHQLLLRRRERPRRLDAATLARLDVEPGRWVVPPPNRGLLFAKATFELSALGRLRKALYKVGPVHLDVIYCDGTWASHRIVPDTARNGLLLTSLAADERAGPRIARVFDRRSGPDVARFRFSGPGLRSFRDRIPVVLEEVTDAEEQGAACGPPPPAAPDLEARTAPDGKPFLAVDVFAPEIDEGGGVLRIAGWAVDPLAGTPASAVLVEVAGRTHLVPVREERADVAAAFGVPAYARSGFRGLVTLDDLPAGLQPVQLRVVSADGRGYFDVPERRQLRR
jgi:hypothetical protein